MLGAAWWMYVFPGIVLATTVLCINVLGDRLRTAMSPQHLHAP
jgi:ABC-type dipeptide/oligopeptide/nickel transport system permease subunit